MSISLLPFSLDLFRVGMEQPCAQPCLHPLHHKSSLIFSVHLSLSLCTGREMMALLQGKIWISDMPTLNGKMIPCEPDSFNWQLHLRL